MSRISVSHLYNLRASDVYRSQRVRVQHTQRIPIGERRKPDPKGKPGYLRVLRVDTVTQWQAVVCVETICERDMLLALEAMLHQFPFRILGFHSDNGAEFINQNVARMLEKLLVEFTKSRAYRTTDNALVEGKNGAVVRKHIGDRANRGLVAEKCTLRASRSNTGPPMLYTPKSLSWIRNVLSWESLQPEGKLKCIVKISNGLVGSN